MDMTTANGVGRNATQIDASLVAGAGEHAELDVLRVEVVGP